MAAGIRRGRCEFPNCMCPCMELHGDGGMCSRCHHVDAWHANLDRSSTTDYAEALGLTSLAAPRGRVPSPSAEDPEQHPAAQATQVRPPCRGTARVPASTDTLVANILSQEMKTDRTLCCICLERHCNTVVKPCGHARFCNTCVLALPSPKKCPLCRERVLRKTNFIPI